MSLALLLCTWNAQATNLLNNADFESGVFGTNLWNQDGIWNGEQNGSIVTGVNNGVGPYNGNGMFQIGDAGGGSAAQMAQWVGGAFTSGTTLTFDAMLNANNAGAIVHMTINAFIGNQLTTLVDDVLNLDGDTSTWQALSISTVLGSDVTGVYTQVWLPMQSGYGGSNYIDIAGNYAYVDGTVLTATGVPAPGALALFGLGLLAMAARRSKRG